MMSKKINLHSPSWLTHPFFLFSTFTLSNAVLFRENHFPFTLKIFVFLFGIFIPFGLSLLLSKHGPHRVLPTYTFETFEKIPSGVWTLLWSLILITQILLVSTRTDWPLPDEGLMGFYALELSKKWSWHFFFSHAQTPPFSIWVLAVIFKLFGPSLEILRILPSLIIVATCVSAYFAARSFVSRSLTFMLVALTGLSFYPLYLSRFCDYTPMLFCFETTCLAIVGWLYQSPSELPFSGAISLGFFFSLGLGLASAWPLALVILTVAIYFLFRKIQPFPFLSWLGYLTPVLLSIMAFLIISVSKNNGQHIQSLLFFNGPWSWKRQLSDALSYVSALFWGCNLQNSYGPVWGGLLNPILGSFFLLGLLAQLRFRFSPLTRWTLVSLVIGLLPGLLSKGFNAFRILLALPFILLLAGIGIQSLLSFVPIRGRSFLLIIFLSLSFLLDLNHVLKTKSPEFQMANNSSGARKAFDILKQQAQSSGPGLIFLSFEPDMNHLALHTACYDFNAAENPLLDSTPTTWAATIVNANYESFLKKRFPRARFYVLGPDQFWNQGPLMLAVIPIASHPAVFALWFNADKQFQQVDSETLLDHSGRHVLSILKRFAAIEPNLRKDRFLESVFYEKLIYLERKNPNKNQLIALINLALQKGYPSAHLWVTDGLLLRNEGDFIQARNDFKMATHCSLNLTDAQKNLEILRLLKWEH